MNPTNPTQTIYPNPSNPATRVDFVNLVGYSWCLPPGQAPYFFYILQYICPEFFREFDKGRQIALDASLAWRNGRAAREPAGLGITVLGSGGVCGYLSPN